MYTLCLSCPDQPGLVAAVSACLQQQNCNIEEAAQFHEPKDNYFFMRIIFSGDDTRFREAFSKIAEPYHMDWEIHSAETPTKTLILVSQWDHCLHDLLYRGTAGHLGIDIAGVASNHETARAMVETYGIPFHHLDVSKEDKKETQITSLIKETGAELIILARYMQILSDDFCGTHSGRIINIHHSFLPGFKGAKPYHQAYTRGVKMIGATAHFVTGDLDEGPIIVQEVHPIDHTYTPTKMQALGRDVERQALAKAVKLYVERRIFLHNKRTIIL